MKHFSLLLTWVCLWLAAVPAQAVLTVELAAANSTNPTAFLIEAESLDAASDREFVKAALALQLFNANFVFDDDIEVEAAFGLINQSTGLPVDLQSGGTTVVTTEVFTLGPRVRNIEQVAGDLQPAAMLDPEVNHRVSASVRYRYHGGPWSAPVVYSGPWKKWIHFFNTTPDDDSLNVKLFAGSLVVDDSQILKSVTGQESFKAALGMTLHRYDIESLPQPETNVPVTFALRLYDSVTLVEVPLAISSITVQRPMLGRTAGTPPGVVTDAWSQSLEFAPAVGEVIDPMATYALEVTVTAQEPDLTPIPSTPPTKTAAAMRYLLLSGKLWFGGVETIFTELANDPSPPMSFNLGAYSTQLSVVQGSAPAAPGRRYGDSTLLNVSYDPVSGDATVTGGTQLLTTNDSDVITLGGLRFVRGVIRMDFSGALLESGGIIFPAGFGVSTSQRSLRHEPGLNLIQEALNNDFSLPFSTRMVSPPPGQYFYAFCDRLPIRFRTSAITWNVNAGTFAFTQTATGDPADPAEPVLTRKFQEDELAALAPLLAENDAADRPSNDSFLKNITSTSPVTVAQGAQGQASLSVQFDLGAGQMQTHYPQGVTLSWAFGRFTVEENVITGPNYLETSAPITVSYKRDCDGGTCGGAAGPGQMVFAPTADRLYITADGGLRADGSITPERLRWGTTEVLTGGSAPPPPPDGPPYFAHQTSQWSVGAFHASGFWITGAVSMPVSDAQRAQSLLLSGSLADGSFERPLTEGYRAGLADYAGLNLRVGSPGAKTGRSVLAAISTPDYDMNARSKYYIRASGVTGIHEAQTFPSALVMYDFDVEFDGLRLAFRDGLNVESKTGGAIHVDSPVQPLPGFDLAFKELSFKCRGQPNKMHLATEGETKSLAYWGTDFTPLSLEFAQPVSPTGCDSVTSGFLLVGAQTRFPSVTPQKLHATLAFRGIDGNLVTKANPLVAGHEVDSRFTLPPTIQVVGAGGVPWEVTITGRAYLNNPSPLPVPGQTYTRPDNGFLTFPATMNVPWFEDMKVQFHASASSTATTASLLHIMGGWPTNPANGNGQGWQMGGQNFFTNKFFDSDHLAFPLNMTVLDYRSPNTPEFNARAQKRWLGVVDFNFPLEWEATQRRFKSSTEQSDDLLVLGSVHRQVRSLTPSTAELTFGVELDIPRVNTASLAAAVKEGISNVVADALSEALGGVLRDQLGGGIAELDALLSERVNDVWRDPLNVVADSLANDLTNPTRLTALQLSLTTLDIGSQVSTRMQSGIVAIDAALAVVGNGGGRANVGALVKRLLEKSDMPGVATLAETAVNTALAQVLPKIEADLEQAQDALTRARAALVQAQTRVANQLPAIFQENAFALNAAASLAVQDVDALVTRNEWTLLDATARRDRVRRLVSERVMACAAVPRFQYVVRQHVQDTNEVFRAALDDVFGQVNQLMRAVIESIPEVASQLPATAESKAIGGLGERDSGDSKLAGINIEGYAQINDESLRVLDINGKFEFNIPDSMLVQAHLRIEEYDANSPAAGCRGAGSMAAVVQIDARAECEWINTTPTIVEIGAKFSLQNGDPVGFDGYFAIAGEIRLGPVVVNEARFLAGFGEFTGPGGTHWGYVGAKIRGRFEAYEAAVGVFFGRTCDVEVIKMIDPQVGKALTDSKVGGGGAVTGVYFYGEAWIPINEVFGIPSTCLFTVRAGAGAGFFAFIGDDSSSYIGCKQMFGVEGRLLCIFGISGKMTIIGAVASVAAPPTGASAQNGLFNAAKGPPADTSSSFILRGDGEFAAELGVCPFCIELSKSVGLTWTIGGENDGMEIEF